MGKIETKYGTLNGAEIAGYYSTGEPETYNLEEKSELEVLGYKLVPLYDFPYERRKEFPPMKVYKNGNIKSMALDTSTIINTKLGKFEVEKITFYESGQINRLFILDGKLSGYWSEEDEYNLAKAYKFKFEFSSFEAKIMSLHYYKSGELKSLTLWPKERIELKIGEYKFMGRIGFSLYENSKIKSCEPFRPVAINTPIGKIDAYDINAVGIHGDTNSLKFNEDGTVKALITSTNTVTVYTEKGEKSIYSPKKVRLYSNSEILDTITLSIEFEENKIIINSQYEYEIKGNRFEIKEFGEKRMTLTGDVVI
ncbi:hypothetical protein [Clostridium sp. BL-8]|uniref:hypothetical protein n=1 Tax=Clostridium sp. BL-8 TaxID=349938 RepID=UPI00098C221F|nr:hypothetical protein [Clostridium sp. BL-8]